MFSQPHYQLGNLGQNDLNAMHSSGHQNMQQATFDTNEITTLQDINSCLSSVRFDQ